jgi:DNA replication protein DnaC
MIRSRSCRGCKRIVYEPGDFELSLLPEDWRDSSLCAACQIDGPPSDPEVVDLHRAAVCDRLLRSGLPKRYWECSLGDLEDLPQNARDALREWSVADCDALFLCGPAGVGKTFMAASAARVRLEHSFVNWQSMAQVAMNARSDFDSAEFAKSKDLLDRPNALVLDDLGQENPSASTRELLFGLIETRLLHHPLLITSNLLPSELGSRYGAWLPSRIQQMTAIKLDGADRRMRDKPDGS